MATVDHRWRERAQCVEVGPTPFFREKQEKWAKRICGRCPVREECLAYALKTKQDEGVWGGMSAKARSLLSRTANATTGEPLVVVTYTTRARSTGATCSAGRTATGWGAACETHGTLASTNSRTAAGYAVSRPQEWCPDCALIAAGFLPKIARPDAT